MNTPRSPDYAASSGNADGAALLEDVVSGDPVQALRSHSRTAMNQLADDAARVARGGIDAARQRAGSLRDSGSEYVRVHPLTAVLIAAGTGAVLMLLANLLRRAAAAAIEPARAMPALHPLLRAVVLQPRLLLEHVSAYGAVLAEEGSDAAARLRLQLAWQLTAGAALAVSLALAGVAAMLWAVLPQAPPERAWLLLAVPLLPTLGAAWALHRAAQLSASTPFAALRRQAAADLDLLRSLHVPNSEP